ncbi:MAG: LacI family DNA-binding transcriptional regulator [Verrucomicrobiota bacterium]
MSSRRISLKDIADRSGYSKNTVSLALRDSTKLPANTKKKIKRIAKELNYRPNSRVNEAMGYMRSNRQSAFTETIGVLLGWRNMSKNDLAISNQHLARTFEAIDAHAESLGFATDYLQIQENELRPQRLLEIIKSRGIRGLIVPQMENRKSELKLDLSNLAIAQIGRTVWSPQIDTIACNEAEVAILATEMLWKKGYRKIGFYFSNWSLRQSKNRLQMGVMYCQQTMPEIESIVLEVNKRLQTPTDVSNMDLLREEFVPWFKKHKPDVVVGIIPKLRYIIEEDLKLRVPKDVGLVQFDYVPKPGLEMAGVSHQKDLQAKHAVDFIASKLYHNQFGIPKSPIELNVECKWIDGSTIQQVG